MSREWLADRAMGVFGFFDVTSVGGHCGPSLSGCSSQTGLDCSTWDPPSSAKNVVVLDVVVEESARLGSSKVCKLVHVAKPRSNSRQSGSLRYSCDMSFGLLQAISQRIPNELLDPFGESPSELRRDFTTSFEPWPDAQA
ncbi:hypothetical protein GW17_00051791 [Ensete ventricosum]|nr:hypothetical protein GW17_00051791 [Ensete ventricosum]